MAFCKIVKKGNFYGQSLYRYLSLDVGGLSSDAVICFDVQIVVMVRRILKFYTVRIRERVVCARRLKDSA